MGLSELAGPGAVKLFVSRSGRDLTGFVMPGMFTRSGYQTLMLPMIDLETTEYVENNWVLGQHNKQTSPISFDALKNAIVDVYKTDYINHWDEFLADLEVRRAGQPGQTVALLEAAGELGTFSGLYAEIEGDAHMANGDMDAARTSYQRALDGIEQGVGDRRTLETKLNDTRRVAAAVSDDPIDTADPATAADVEDAS